MTHYDTLGVPKDADADTIKRAYRRKSKAAHPDKGGAHTDMVAINRAYDTLSDPEKRERYDQTGEDGAPQKSRDQLARDAIMQIFAAVVEKASDYDNVIDGVGEALGQNLSRVKGDISAMEKRITRLERQAKRLKHKGASPNFLAELIADQIGKSKAAVADMRNALAMLKRAQELLSDFAWEADVRAAPVFAFTVNSRPAEIIEQMQADIAKAFQDAMNGTVNPST